MNDPPAKLISIKDLADILDSIRAKLENVEVEAYIIGSVVEGSAVAGDSDLDLLIISSRKLDWYSLFEEELFQLLEKGIALHIHLANNPTYKRMIDYARNRGLRIA